MSPTADTFDDPVALAHAMVEHVRECGSGFNGFVEDSDVYRQEVGFSCLRTSRRFSISVRALRCVGTGPGRALARMWATPEGRAKFAANPRSEL